MITEQNIAIRIFLAENIQGRMNIAEWPESIRICTNNNENNTRALYPWGKIPRIIAGTKTGF